MKWFKHKKPKPDQVFFWFNDYGCIPGDVLGNYIPHIGEEVIIESNVLPNRAYVVTRIEHKSGIETGYCGRPERAYIKEITIILEPIK